MVILSYRLELNAVVLDCLIVMTSPVPSILILLLACALINFPFETDVLFM